MTEERIKQTVYALNLKKGEEIQFSLSQYKGHAYVDMRIWFESKAADGKRPTKKGLNFSLSKLTEFQKGLECLKQAGSKTFTASS